MQMTSEDIKPGKFYACQYDNDQYFCVAIDVSSENGDVNMKFLHPKVLQKNSSAHNVMMSIGF